MYIDELRLTAQIKDGDRGLNVGVEIKRNLDKVRGEGGEAHIHYKAFAVFRQRT